MPGLCDYIHTVRICPLGILARAIGFALQHSCERGQASSCSIDYAPTIVQPVHTCCVHYLQAVLRDVRQLTDAEVSRPAATHQPPWAIMQAFAALHRGCVRSEDVTDCTDALRSVLAIAVDRGGALHHNIHFLSDLSWLLEKQPPLHRRVMLGQGWIHPGKRGLRSRLSLQLRPFVYILFNRVIADIDVKQKINDWETVSDSDVARLALAQSRMRHCHTAFWVWLKEERRHCGTPGTTEFADIMFAAAQLQDKVGCPWPADALQQIMGVRLYRGMFVANFKRRPQYITARPGPPVTSAWGAPKMLQAYATLSGHCLTDEVATALVDTAMQEAPCMGPEDIVTTWTALVQLYRGYGPPAVANGEADALLAATARVAPDLAPSEVAAMWLAYSQLVCMPASPGDREVRGALHAATARSAPDMKLSDIDRIWDALTKLGSEVPVEAHDALCVATVRLAIADHDFEHELFYTSPAILADAWWALAALHNSSRGKPPGIDVDIDALHAATADVFQTKRTSLQYTAEGATSVTLHCFAQLRLGVPPATQAALKRAMLLSIPSMTPAQIAQARWALRVLAWPTDPAGTELPDVSELHRQLQVHAELAADEAAHKTTRAKALLEALTTAAARESDVRHAEREVAKAAVCYLCALVLCLPGLCIVHNCKHAASMCSL